MAEMRKVIIYCADGTWNGAGKDELLEADKPELSNVYRLYRHLKGGPSREQKMEIGLWTELRESKSSGGIDQIAMYCHGVGENQRNWEEKIVGGIFGGGLTTRIRMGYAFISRNFNPGDSIVIIGFSRGAYTARALADFIVNQGLLRHDLAFDHLPLSFVEGAWLSHRRASRADRTATSLSVLINASEDAHLAGIIAANRMPGEQDYVAATISVLAVFDTVGSVGLPHFHGGERVDDYEYVDTRLHPKINRAFHAVSLDEQRQNFRPTLWTEPDPARLQQVVFPGAHSDVGGGYAEHELSDVPLQWMAASLANDVSFEQQWTLPIKPCPTAISHTPWLHGLAKLGARKRSFPNGILTISASVRNRMAAQSVPLEGGAVDSPYLPQNLPEL